MLDNYGKEVVAYLPELRFEGINNPVVIIKKDGDLVYSLRVQGTKFRPFVFEEGNYTIVCGEPETENMKELKGIKTVGFDNEEFLPVSF